MNNGPQKKKVLLGLSIDPDDLNTLARMARKRGYSTIQELMRVLLHQEAASFEHAEEQAKYKKA